MKKVLIVDDASIMRKLIRKSFEKCGYTEIEEAHDGEDALRKVRAFLPNIITMDVGMPDCNGIDIIEKIRQISPNSKILMVTGDGKAKTVIDSVNAGASQFIVKPFSFESFSKALKGMGEPL